jgi:hypothetical protein
MESPITYALIAITCVVSWIALNNRKLADRLKSTGEFSIEVWAAPANVTQEDAYLVSYSGGVTARNVTLAQRAYQYEALTRTGTPVSTPLPTMPSTTFSSVRSFIDAPAWAAALRARMPSRV